MADTIKYSRLVVEELPRGGFVVGELGIPSRGEWGMQLAAFSSLTDALVFVADTMSPADQAASKPRANDRDTG